MELFFLALADKTRLRLLNLMRRSEICVGFFVDVLGESQPKISRHLAYLRNAGIVEIRRDGKWIHYKIVEPVNELEAQVLQNTLEWLASEKVMRQDYEKLAEVCRSSNLPTTVSGVPKPNIFADEHMNDDGRNPRRELETFLL